MQSRGQARTDLPVMLIFRNDVKSSREKYSACAVGQITGFSSRRPAPDTEALRGRHETWRGMRWTRRLHATSEADRGRPSRVVLISRRWDQSPGQEPGGTVAKKPAHRGEHEAAVNTNRACGNAGLFPVDLSTRVLLFLPLHTRPRVHRRPAFPTPSGRKRMTRLGRNAPRERESAFSVLDQIW
jgi:hypothetical protein